MSIRHAARPRKGVVVAAAAALALGLAGCGDGEGGKVKQSPQPPASQGSAPGTAAPGPGAAKSPLPVEVIAAVKGEAGMVLTLNRAARDAGGFVTFEGQLQNTGGTPYVNTAPWRGNELNASGVSVAGVSLIDKAGKKRYYVLRDTDGRCLCTTGLAIIEAGQTVPFFAQFPAPPAATTEVDFNLPTFATATVKISG